MADNLTVLNSTGGTFTIRMKDVGSGILAGMNLPVYTAAQLTQAAVSVSASSNNTLVTRATGTIKVYGMYLVPDSPVTMTFFNGSSASVLSGAMAVASLVLPVQTEPWFTTTGTNNFVLNLSSSGQVSGMIYYLDN